MDNYTGKDKAFENPQDAAKQSCPHPHLPFADELFYQIGDKIGSDTCNSKDNEVTQQSCSGNGKNAFQKIAQDVVKKQCCKERNEQTADPEQLKQRTAGNAHDHCEK